uniref:UDP-N-acetylglucosamine--peptide N-acetylglucosaminyltransferase SPINDLY n=1 Tax=Chromera velia CCMP2878 TaxID=1169474 RepID=A0A0G4IFW0_9ALVE|eukprot:Cvel_14089.t1-p1 / transcript=Cvel_14089.t1 / gene=Cvel_14089 / organism=Chromera_velia_CCMP2878 / gene_product=Tetratricopeptide repeat protein 6, putative / transcript_product=Tetratricopeptide repeat protein 6, putative / location=Cvel_scaffold990:29173-34121(-) / protein_length=831 / sequence_SO=supercontig / SO=protein_coding / is_pseudo=false
MAPVDQLKMQEETKDKAKLAQDLYKNALTLFKKTKRSQLDLEQCAQMLTEAISLRPSDGKYYFQRGKVYVEMTRFPQALFDYGMALRLEPANDRYFAARGYCFRKLRRVPEALMDYNDALRHNKDQTSHEALKNRSEYHFSRALVYYDLKNFETAIQDFTAAIEKKLPKAHKAYHYRGICYRNIDRITESIEDLKMAVQGDGDNPESHNQLGLSLCENQQYDLAKFEFSRAVELDGQARYFSNKGQALYHLGRKSGGEALFTQALQDFTVAIDREEGNPNFHFHRGCAYYELKQYDDALADFDIAIRLNEKAQRVQSGASALEADEQETESLRKRTAEFLHHKGLAYAAKGTESLPNAIAFFQKALEANPQHAASRFHLGLMFHLDGQFDRALKAFSLVPPDHSLHEARGLLLRDMGQHAEALDDFDSAIDLEPSNFNDFTNRGIVFLRMGKPEDALNDFNTALQLRWEDAKPKTPVAPLGTAPTTPAAGAEGGGTVQLPAQGEEAAEGETPKEGGVEGEEGGEREGHSNAPVVTGERKKKFAELYSYRGLTWRVLGDLGAAVTDMTRAIEMDDTRPSYLSNRAKCFFELGELERSEEDLSRAVKMCEDAGNQQGLLLFERGLTRYTMRTFRNAIGDFKAALEAPVPLSHRLLPELYYFMGVSFANLGKHAFAVPSFDNAMHHATNAPEEDELKGPWPELDANASKPPVGVYVPHYVHERAKALQAVGQHARALQDFSVVLDMQPSNARALFRRAFSYKALRAFEDAAEDFESARKFAPDDPRMVLNYQKIHDVPCISLGPAGHEDPIPHNDATTAHGRRASRTGAREAAN